MRRSLAAYFRLLLPICLLLLMVLTSWSPARAVESTTPLWGPQAADPTVKVLDAQYTAPEEARLQCHDQDFVLRTAPDDQYYQLFKDTTYTRCAFYTDFGLVGEGNVLYLNDTPRAYHISSPYVLNIISTPNAHSLFFQEGQLIVAYDHPQDNFEVVPGSDDMAFGASYQYEYRLKAGIEPRVLKDSRGSLIQYAGHTKISQNGDWLIMQKNSQLLRVKADDFSSVLTFPGDLPFQGQTASNDLAISNDGRYAVSTESKQHLSFKMYDLSTCVPDQSYNLNTASGCEPLNMTELLREKLGEQVDHVDEPQFSPDGEQLTVRVIAESKGNKHTELVELTAPGADSTDWQPTATNYIALGDSYASGEGAFDYFSGTDNDYNKCHLSRESYPYLLGLKLQLDSVHSVACSGGRMINVNGFGTEASQHTVRPLDAYDPYWLPGYSPQLQFIQDKKPNVVTISMVGNDVGFADIIKRCILFDDTCYSSYEERLGLVLNINDKFNSLVTMYEQIKNAAAPNAKVYIIGYPSVIKPDGNCGVNVRMNQQETEFAGELTDYLDTVIKQAAAKAGVQYVDTENSFDGYRLCDDDSAAKPAVNGLTAGNDTLHLIGQESYHPTAFGHQLLAGTIAGQTNGFSQPDPAEDWSITVPDISAADGLLSVPKSGQTLRKIEEYVSPITVIPGGAVVTGVLDAYKYHLDQNTTYNVSIHSTPIQLGTATTDDDGNLNYSFTIPSSIEPGWHTIDVEGTDITGQAVDIQRIIYVAASANDWDGDGVPNSQEPCGVITPSGIDADHDGTDDACDGVIGLPGGTDSRPSDTTTGKPDSLPDDPAASAHSALQSTVGFGLINNGSVTDVAQSSGPPAGNVLGAQATTAPQRARDTHSAAAGNTKWLPITIVLVMLLVGSSWLVRRYRRA